MNHMELFYYNRKNVWNNKNVYLFMHYNFGVICFVVVLDTMVLAVYNIKYWSFSSL